MFELYYGMSKNSKTLPDFDEIKGKVLILETASDLFSEFGRDGVKMEKVADVSGLTFEQIHEYFNDIDELYSQVLWYLWYKGQIDLK